MDALQFKPGDIFTGKPFTRNGELVLESIKIIEVNKSIASDRVRIVFRHESAAATCVDFAWLEIFEQLTINMKRA